MATAGPRDPRTSPDWNTYLYLSFFLPPYSRCPYAHLHFQCGHLYRPLEASGAGLSATLEFEIAPLHLSHVP